MRATRRRAGGAVLRLVLCVAGVGEGEVGLDGGAERVVGDDGEWVAALGEDGRLVGQAQAGRDERLERVGGEGVIGDEDEGGEAEVEEARDGLDRVLRLRSGARRGGREEHVHVFDPPSDGVDVASHRPPSGTRFDQPKWGRFLQKSDLTFRW